MFAFISSQLASGARRLASLPPVRRFVRKQDGAAAIELVSTSIGGKLALTVRIVVTPLTGKRYTTTRTVTLHA